MLRRRFFCTIVMMFCGLSWTSQPSEALPKRLLPAPRQVFTGEYSTLYIEDGYSTVPGLDNLCNSVDGQRIARIYDSFLERRPAAPPGYFERVVERWDDRLPPWLGSRSRVIFTDEEYPLYISGEPSDKYIAYGHRFQGTIDIVIGNVATPCEFYCGRIYGIYARIDDVLILAFRTQPVSYFLVLYPERPERFAAPFVP